MNEYRQERARILQVLKDCTGTHGDDLAAPRVLAFLRDPEGGSIKEFGYISALELRRFYGGVQTKPDKSDRSVLWSALMTEFDKANTKDPGGWGPETNTSQLHGIVKEAK